VGSISADANAKMFTTAHLCSIPYISALREQEATTCAYHSNLGCAYYIYTTMKGTSEAVQWKWYHKRSCHKCWRHRGMISHFCDIMSDWLSAGGLQYKSNNRQQRGHSFARIQTHHSDYAQYIASSMFMGNPRDNALCDIIGCYGRDKHCCQLRRRMTRTLVLAS